MYKDTNTSCFNDYAMYSTQILSVDITNLMYIKTKVMERRQFGLNCVYFREHQLHWMATTM